MIVTVKCQHRLIRSAFIFFRVIKTEDIFLFLGLDNGATSTQWAGFHSGRKRNQPSSYVLYERQPESLCYSKKKGIYTSGKLMRFSLSALLVHRDSFFRFCRNSTAENFVTRKRVHILLDNSVI